MRKFFLVFFSAFFILIMLAGMAIVGAWFLNRWELDFTLEGPEEITLEVGSEYQEFGAKAHGEGSLVYFIEEDPKIAISGEVDPDTVGTYTVTYKTAFQDIFEEKTRTIHVVDTQKPTIELESVEDDYTLPGQPYEEEGFHAQDNYDGDITDRVTSYEKDGVVYYEVSDSSGNTATAARIINYDDREAPVLTLEGGDITLNQGTAYEEPGYTATDNVDGDITDKVTVETDLDVQKPGTYTITYKVKDAYKNEAEATRTVTIKEVKPASDADADKLIYLTFDDGPGKYTERLLGILDKYDVKATFFVTNQFPGYQDMIGKAAAAGHAIGVHTYSHVFSEVYASDEAYWEDFNRMNDIIEAQTGHRSVLMRFPGGSSNAVSAKYNEGIMTRLTQQAEEKGYSYFDWNVLSGDAGETKDSDQIVENILEGIDGKRISVVLCHDIHEYTVDAMEEMIQKALEEGYTFAPLNENSFTAHQHVNN